MGVGNSMPAAGDRKPELEIVKTARVAFMLARVSQHAYTGV